MRVLVLVLCLYVALVAVQWLQGYCSTASCSDHAAAALRRRGQAAPAAAALLRQQPRGELLSRVTNDIDNVQQTMQQTFSQLLNALLTLIGVLTMMLIISPLLALVALVSVPLSMVVTRLIAKRSQPLFVQQWGHTGRLNAHIEETYTGHALVRVFGHQAEAEEEFRNRNEELYKASYGAQFLSGIILPAIMFIGNLNYVFVAVIGGLRVASGSMSLGDVQAFIQYSRQFSQPLTQVASMSNLLQSGVASAERVFELLDADEQVPEDAAPTNAGRRAARPGGVRARVVPLRAGRAADRGPLAGRVTGTVGGDRRPDRRREDHPGQPDHAVLRAGRRPDHLRRA
jgi:ATP-binding cassette subfamily B protein